jgi:hypothetical protein
LQGAVETAIERRLRGLLVRLIQLMFGQVATMAGLVRLA